MNIFAFSLWINSRFKIPRFITIERRTDFKYTATNHRKRGKEVPLVSEVEILLVVVAAIYLSECVAWLPKQSIVLTGIQRRLCRAAAPGVLGNDQKQLFLLNLLPTSTTLITRQPSHLFQNESLLIRKLDGAWHAISYQEIDSSTVRADDNSVVVGEHRLPESSRKAANQTASVIQRIA